jgi:hypothetical protein
MLRVEGARAVELLPRRLRRRERRLAAGEKHEKKDLKITNHIQKYKKPESALQIINSEWQPKEANAAPRQTYENNNDFLLSTSRLFRIVRFSFAAEFSQRKSRSL